MVQDTLLALEALTEFSYRQTNRAFYNLQLQFECTSNSSWKQTVKLDKSNFAQLYTFSVCCLYVAYNNLIKDSSEKSNAHTHTVIPMLQ